MAASKWRFGVAGLFLFGGAVLASASGCVEAEARFYIERVCTPGAKSTDGTCDDTLYVPEVGGTFQCLAGSCTGALDVGYGGGVRTFVVNGLEPSLQNASNNNKVETSNVLLTEYIVEVSDDSGVVLAWTTPSNGVIPPTQDSADHSEAAFIILTNDLMTELDGRLAGGEEISLVVGIELHGRTTGGLEVETPMTYFPLYLTKG